MIATMVCSIFEIVSCDDLFATEVIEALENALEETAAAKALAAYTPYPTYTPMPTYTPQYYGGIPPLDQKPFPGDNIRLPMPRR